MKLDIGKMLLQSVKIYHLCFRQHNMGFELPMVMFKISLLKCHQKHSDQSYWSFEVTSLQ